MLLQVHAYRVLKNVSMAPVTEIICRILQRKITQSNSISMDFLQRIARLYQFKAFQKLQYYPTGIKPSILIPEVTIVQENVIHVFES